MADGLDFGKYSDLAGDVQTVETQSSQDTSGLQTPSTSGVLSPTSNTTFGNALAYGIPGLTAGLIDTLGQSLHIFNNNTVPDALKAMTGSDENSLGDFYSRHQAGLRTGGEIAGMLLPGLTAMKLLKSVNGLREAGSIGAWAKNSTAIDILLGSSADMAEAQKAVSASVSEAVSQQGIWAGRTVMTPEVMAAKRTLYAKKAVDAVRTTVAFELGSFAGLNSSQTFYPADMTYWDQAKWAGLGLATGVGLEMAATRFAVRSMTQAAVKATAQDVSLSPLQKDAAQVMFRPGKRGVGITAYAGMDADLQQTISVANNPATLKTNLTQDMTNIKKTLSEQIYQMGYDTHEFLPRLSLDQKQIDLGIKALKSNPTSLLFATKLATVPGDMSSFYGDIAEGLDKAKTKFNTAVFAASSKFGQDTPEFFAAQQKAITELRPTEKAASEQHYVIEPDGSWTIFKNRAANWLDSNSLSDIKRKGYTTPNPADADTPLKNSKLMAKGTNDIVLHDNGRFELPATPTPMDFSTAYAMGSRLINDWKPVEGQTFIATPKLNWRSLEIISALAKKYPEARNAVRLGGAVSNPETANLGKIYPLAGADLPSTGLRPANLNPDGIVYVGAPGDLHVSISEKFPAKFTKIDGSQQVGTGFVTPEGKFLNRKDALTWTNANGQPVKPASNMGNMLDAADYREQTPWVNKDLGFTSLDDIDFHVLNAKFKEFQRLMPNTAAPAISNDTSLLARLKSRGSNFTPAEVLQRLNLPVPVGYSDAPLIETFAHAKLQGMTDLNDMFPKANGGAAFNQPYTQMDLLKQHLRETAGVTDPKAEIPIQGNLLAQTAETKPLFVASTSTPMATIADANINTRVLAMRDVQLQKLQQIDPSASPLLSGVIGKIINPNADLAGAANTARAVQTLQDGVLSGTGQVVYQDRINEQFPALKALQLVAQDGDKFIDNYVTTLAGQNLTPRYANILAQKNKGDLLDFNRIEQAYRHGWDIKSIADSPSGNGAKVFVLDPTSQSNKQLFAEHFPSLDLGEDGKAMPLHMPDMSVTAKKSGYQPLQVSANSASLAQAISDMSIQSGRENNTLRMALGKTPITIRDFHLPTPELNKEGTWFVRNPIGRVIATYTGPNFSQNEQRAKAAATTLGEGHIAVPLETVKMDHQINDDNFFDVIDYSDQLAKTGSPIRGGLAHTEIDTGPLTLQAMIKSLQEQYLNIGVRARAAVFEPELNYARQAAQVATVSTRDNLGGMNIFDRYISTMFSQTPKGTEPGALKKVYSGIEGGLDKSLTWLYGHYAAIAPVEGNSVGAKTVNTLLRKSTSEAEYKQFAPQLADWSPFKDTEAWRESTLKEASPPSIRKLSALLSRVSSTMSLRFLDEGTAINNFAGLMTNSPSVVTALRRLPNEGFDDWISRTAAYGTQLHDSTVTFSPMKALGTAIKSYWRGELTAPMADAAEHGYFLPEYASLTKALTLPEKPSQQALERFVHYASYGADRSESLSRQISWGLGYKIGKDLHKFDDERNAYIFANNFVNEMIGNYSPNNKPSMFQGAVGLPLGSFQTYMANFYRRLYGYVERGDKASVLAQYAAQASLFGAKGVPGYGAWNSVFQSNFTTGSDDFTTRLQRNLSPGVAELLLNGSLSNIPKIWGGLQGNGLAFYTRGSVDYTSPVPTLLDMSKAPPMQFLADTFGGIKETIKNVFAAGGFSLQQQEEILANFTTNRALKSIMEMAANAKTDKRGNVVEMGTRDAMHVAAGLLGTQTTYNRSQMDAINKQRDIQNAQADLQATLSAHTKAILRGGNFSVSALQSVVNNYITNGGNPAYIGQWFRNDLMNATTPKAQEQLESLARSGKMLEFENMLAAMQQNAKNPLAANPKFDPSLNPNGVN